MSELLGSIENRNRFAEKHGFSFKRPQDFKNCILIKWDYGKFLDSKGKRRDQHTDRTNEKAEILFKCLEYFKAWPPKPGEPILCDTEAKLCDIGIYAFHSWDRPHWAIPNCYPEVQAWVKEHLPEWAILKVKKTS